jgi:predicted RNA binding protein YcfA (HicA-like mRNA interferase family)
MFRPRYIRRPDLLCFTRDTLVGRCGRRAHQLAFVRIVGAGPPPHATECQLGTLGVQRALPGPGGAKAHQEVIGLEQDSSGRQSAAVRSARGQQSGGSSSVCVPMARPLPGRFRRASRSVSALPRRARRSLAGLAAEGLDGPGLLPPDRGRADRPKATDVLHFIQSCEISRRWSKRTPRRDSSSGMSQGGPEPTLRAPRWTSCKQTCAKSLRCSSKTESPSSNRSSWERRTSESREMPAVPPLKPHQVIAALTSLGFVEVRQRGSHKQFRHADGRGTTVSVHQGRDIAPTHTDRRESRALVRKIARDIKVEIDDFLAQV